MKIGYILGEFPSLSETFILREILALRAAGLDIRVFAQRRGIGEKIHAQALSLLPSVVYPRDWTEPQWWRSQLLFAGRHFPRLGALLCRIVWQYRAHPVRLLKMLCRIPAAVGFADEAEACGITHLHAHFAFLPADLAMMMATLLDIPFSVAVHARDIYAQSPGLLACRLSRAAFVVTCSQYNRDFLRRTLPGLNPELVHLVRHGLDLSEFQPRAMARELILGVGRMERKKGFEYLIEACRILRDRGVSFQCAIIGEGEGEARLRGLIVTHRLDSCVRLTKMLTQEELLPWYLRAKVFVQPSVIAPDGDRDALPNVLLEAMAMQVPVVATRIAAIPELVADGETGLLAESADSADLANKMARLLQEPVLGQSVAERARRKVEAEYDIRRNILPLIALFRGSAGSAGKG